jgi:hypothetical protein
MVPFLKKFGVCVGNGMSPFSVEFSTPEQLLNLMITYFKPPRRDPRDKEPGSNVDVQQMDDDDADGDDTDNEEEEDNGDSIEADLSATLIEEFINDTAEVDKDLQAGSERMATSTNVHDASENVDDIFGKCDGSRMFLEFKEMLLDQKVWMILEIVL